MILQTPGDTVITQDMSMDRRDFIRNAAVGAASLAIPRRSLASSRERQLREENTIHVNPASGSDANPGSRVAPLRTLPEAARRVSRSDASGPLTVILAEGIHVVGETALFRPERRSFSSADRLTVRAEVLPDDPEWHYGRMPTLIHTMPLQATWNGRPDPLGGAADGMLIDTSHVTVQGLRILGMPVVESPRAGLIRRLYAVSRLRESLNDLVITQCLFVGDEVIAPNHVGIIARGNGLVVDHCVFRGLKISAVYWSGGSTGHAMRHCVNEGLYGSAVWTAGIADDFDYRNNVVANCNYAWTHQDASSARADAGGGRAAATQQRARSRYRVVRSYFANNRRLTGSGTGARLEYQDIDPSFLELVGTQVTDAAVRLEMDAAKREYLHPVAGSDAAQIGAGLFTG